LVLLRSKLSAVEVVALRRLAEVRLQVLLSLVRLGTLGRILADRLAERVVRFLVSGDIARVLAGRLRKAADRLAGLRRTRIFGALAVGF
jgi:hypothetical protein